jgi:DNA processing protein
MMDEIRGFWVGARKYRGETELTTLAERAGGWPAFISGGPELWVSLGVDAQFAEAWAATKGERTSGRALTLDDPRYPAVLAKVPNAPPVLCIEGSVEILQRPMIAVVGTRECTSYGSSVARHLAAALSRAGLVVVSGLARGIDAHAHQASVADTVAVLAHGLSHQAPPSNAGLRRKIVESGGAMVTAFPDAEEPRPYHFPNRNRWIAGLAQAVIVVEAPVTSGTMWTTKAALDLGRDVYAVPGQVGSVASRGCLHLLRDGAALVWDVDELVAHFAGESAPKRADWQLALFAGATVDEAARVANRPTTELLAELGRMELEGVVRRLPGQRYAPR